jgi:hypothetical protein
MLVQVGGEGGGGGVRLLLVRLTYIETDTTAACVVGKG